MGNVASVFISSKVGKNLKTVSVNVSGEGEKGGLKLKRTKD